MLLSSHFQGFCRDLHSECVDHIVRVVQPDVLRETLRTEFVLARKLDRGNPNPGNIGADFMRLGIDFWREVRADDARNAIRQQRIELLGEWRNAIAHQAFGPNLEPRSLTLVLVRRWRSSCQGLAKSFDRVLARYIAVTVGEAPW